MFKFSSWVKLGRLAVLLVCLFCAAAAYPASPRFKCGKLDATLISYLSKKYSINSVGAASIGIAVQIMVDKHGNWIMLGIDENLNTCQIMRGTDWNWFAEGGA